MASRPVRTARSSELLGGALVGLTSLQFGGVVVLGKLAAREGLPVPSMLAVRFAVAGLLLVAVLAVLRQPVRAAPGEGWPLAVLGSVGYAAEAGLFFAALQHGSVPAVSLLFFTYPVWVALIALLRGRGLPGWLLGGALASTLAGAGLVVVAAGGVEIEVVGIALAIGSALTFAAYISGADAVVRNTNSLSGSMLVSASAAAGLTAYAFAADSAMWPAGWREWVPVVGMGTLTAGAFVCLFAGLRRLGAVRTSIVAASEPLAASLLAAIFLGEVIRAGTAAGGILILGGAVAASLARATPEAPGP